MTMSKGALSALSRIAEQRRDEFTRHRDKSVNECSSNLANHLLAWDSIANLRAGDIARFLTAWRTNWTDDEILRIKLLALSKAYKTPMALTRDQLHLRQHGIQYHNPTYHKLNIHPLGIPDEQGNTVDFVSPGAVVTIPRSLAIGGKNSALLGVAPQLKELVVTYDESLDLHPTSYAEWIAYCPFKKSLCCQSQVLWSETKQELVCSGCRQSV